MFDPAKYSIVKSYNKIIWRGRWGEFISCKVCLQMWDLDFCVCVFALSGVRADFLSVERSKKKEVNFIFPFLFYLRSAATKNMPERNVMLFFYFGDFRFDFLVDFVFEMLHCSFVLIQKNQKIKTTNKSLKLYCIPLRKINSLRADRIIRLTLHYIKFFNVIYLRSELRN